jgi:putative DNA modification/repair radical SAM protein
MLEDKIGVLADAAKYDASCSTSGSARANTPGGIGSASVGGICHAWSADGRCVALLKVLLSNVCSWDCAYCVNRRSNDVPRAAFEPEELVRLIMDFYRRNYIEGAFLSSGVTGCPDATMERLIHVCRLLRTRERFNGYLHVKIIPGASESLVLEAARWADRASVNIELPSAASLGRIAPDKKPQAIFGPMRVLAKASGFEPRRLPEAGFREPPSLSSPGEDLASKSLVSTEEFRPPAVAQPQPGYVIAPEVPSVFEARKSRSRNPAASSMAAGQTTQMVIGASPESDATILSLAENLYLAYDVRRVYYSAYIPAGSDPRIPAVAKPSLRREHRLYQADWLFRFYGFSAGEILDEAHPFLDEGLDPKSGWALRNMGFFPVEVLSAEYEALLRVPGIGPKSASRIVKARNAGSIRISSLSRLGVVMRRAKWFLTVGGRLASEGDGPEGSTGALRSRAPAARGAGLMLEHPELLRRELLDPGFREQDLLQPALPWDTP